MSKAPTSSSKRLAGLAHTIHPDLTHPDLTFYHKPYDCYDGTLRTHRADNATALALALFVHTHMLREDGSGVYAYTNAGTFTKHIRVTYCIPHESVTATVETAIMGVIRWMERYTKGDTTAIAKVDHAASTLSALYAESTRSLYRIAKEIHKRMQEGCAFTVAADDVRKAIADGRIR